MCAWHSAYTQRPICSIPTVPRYGPIIGADIQGRSKGLKIVRYLSDLIANIDFGSKLNNAENFNLSSLSKAMAS